MARRRHRRGALMWPWRPKTAHVARPPAFDAVIDLGPQTVADLPGQVAMEAASLAVRALPGAAKIRVRLGDGPEPMVVRVFPPGRSEESVGDQWSILRATIATAVVAAIRTQHPAPKNGPSDRLSDVGRPMAAQGTFPVPHGARRGFAESAQRIDALEQLTQLAQAFRAPATSVRAAPRSSEADIAMLARLLRLVLPGDGLPEAAEAVRRLGSYPAVLASTEPELRKVPGLGTQCVAAIKLVHEAAVRLARAGVTGQPVLDDPARLSAYLSAAVGRARVEQFRILFLDAGGMLRADEVQATGTVNHTPVYPREVVRRALELEAAAVVLVHNHPSGDPTPSDEDIAMTAEIRRAAAALGVEVRDHVIVGNGRTLSFRAAGLLE